MSAPLAAAASLGVVNTFQNMLHAAGPQSEHIARLWNIMFAVTGIVFVAIIVATVLAVRRSQRGDARTAPDVSSLSGTEPRLQRAVIVGVALSILGLLGLLGASVFTDRALASLSLTDPIHIQLTANQFWWDVRYEDGQPSDIFTTANEIVVPVGRPVVMRLGSNDVIHSFWVPNVHGKKDLIPGQTSVTQWRVDTPGTFRGQCAEFCGYQHAKMALYVTALPPEQFEQWRAAQRATPPPPTDARLQHGQKVFLTSTCVMCHAIQGTTASARNAPDLTHVGSRRSLAADAVPNTLPALAAWIADPQAFKPGVNMPSHRFSGEDLDALVAYLESLK
jgi:cytochrome c oxidase subunit 2